MANSSKTKTPLKFGWLESNQYHIAVLKRYERKLTYFCLCDKKSYLSKLNGENYIWPDGIYCTEILSIDTICKKCLKMLSKKEQEELVHYFCVKKLKG